MTDFFKDLEKINNTPDLDGAKTVARNQNPYKLEVIDELLRIIASVPSHAESLSVKGTLGIGMVPEEPRPEKIQMENHVKKEFLKKLEHRRLVEGLSFSMERTLSQYDESCPDGFDYILASFAFVPSRLNTALYLIKEKLEAKDSVQGGDVAKEESPSRYEEPTMEKAKGVGYLILNGERIRIGREHATKCRLLFFLCMPFGVPKTIDAVFEHIQTVRHKKDPRFSDEYTSQEAKIKIMKDNLKEINRDISKHTKRQRKKATLPRLGLKLTGDRKSVRLEQRGKDPVRWW